MIKTAGHLRNSEKKLADVRKYLESGNGINWVPGDLSSALYWAMEGWLVANGYEQDYGMGWHGTTSAFKEHASKALCDELLSCFRKAISLEYLLFGSGSNEEENLPSLDEWKSMAYECLNKTDKAFDLLFQDLNIQRSNGFTRVE
jgi:hypothetical protein